ncbi:MAG: hypothetical protein BWY79_02066 [Actinobacteria bacterium ADurb.Bin444]|nr:MAG: hypothetical protein BWY79_02066 [Actinobacteria bacterium ADurb.Bin444]
MLKPALVPEHDGLLAHRHGALTHPHRDLADGGSRRLAQLRRQFGTHMRALLDLHLAPRQLHRKGHTGGKPAILAVGLGQQLIDLKAAQGHGIAPFVDRNGRGGRADAFLSHWRSISRLPAEGRSSGGGAADTGGRRRAGGRLGPQYHGQRECRNRRPTRTHEATAHGASITNSPLAPSSNHGPMTG